MAAGLELPRRMLIHGFLLMGEKKMSKSLGNVLDPFEVIERFGADALRFYCFREVSFGQDGSISTAGFEARYETELANDYGNLASRVLAMVDRYRDGVVPDGRAVDAVLAEDFEGVAAALPRAARPGRADPGAGGDLEAGAAPQPLRRGDPALGAGQGRGRHAERLDEVLYNLAEGLRVTTCCSAPTCRRRASGCSTALGEEGRELAEFGSRGGGQQVERSSAAVPEDRTGGSVAQASDALLDCAVVDTHAHLGVCEPADGDWSRRAAQAGVRRILNVGLDEDSNREAIAAAERHEGVFASVGRHPNSARGFDDARGREIEALAAARAGAGDRRDRARLLPRGCRAADDQRRAFEAQIEIARRRRPAAGDPRPRSRRRDRRAVDEVFDDPRRARPRASR